LTSNQHLPHRVAAEGDDAGQHLEQEDAERVDVGAMVEAGAALARLRRHVLRRAEHHAGGGELAGVAVGQKFGQPEIQQLDEVAVAQPLDEHHVVRLEVAVDDGVGVGGGQRAGDLRADVERAGDRDAALVAGQLHREGLPLEVLHDEEVLAVVGLPEIVDLHDVLVADLVDGARLVEEPADHLLVAGQLAVDDLERDLLADVRMLGEKHHPHPAHADARKDSVIAERLARSERHEEPKVSRAPSPRSRRRRFRPTARCRTGRSR
jgi:hypothetical protein